MELLDPTVQHEFEIPIKRIHNERDLRFFLSSKAYMDVMAFLVQLNNSMMTRVASNILEKDIDSSDVESPGTTPPREIQKLGSLIEKLGAIIDEAPPDPSPRRFGNVSFRRWLTIVESRGIALLDEHLPTAILNKTSPAPQAHTARDELRVYFNGSFGSSQRLDYGTGHELSFLAFLACVWKLGGFSGGEAGELESEIVVNVIEPYLRLMRRLIMTYTLEPAGSHGVWGLDDHFFLPYILGSAQYAPPIGKLGQPAAEGSRPGAPSPGDIVNQSVVEKERQTNMYFAGIGFIYDVKKGPFWEHSPTLFDISGVKAGWAKINKGMLKMYIGEVLSKFPVVQHFPFGSLLRWEHDPSAPPTTNSAHMTSQAVPIGTSKPDPVSATRNTKAPWTSSQNPSASLSRSPGGLPSRPAPRLTTRDNKLPNAIDSNLAAMMPPTQNQSREQKPSDE